LAQAHDAVGEQWDRQDVVQVRMAEDDVLDANQRVERELTDTGSSVDQDIVVEKKGRGPASGGNRAGATEYGDDHGRYALLRSTSARHESASERWERPIIRKDRAAPR
jgi:hypothetical protein